MAQDLLSPTFETKIILLSFGLMLVTFCTRFGFMFLKKNIQLSPQMLAALKFAPMLILATTIALDAFFDKNHFLGVLNPRSLTVLVAVFAYLIRKKGLDGLLAGLFTWLLILYFQQNYPAVFLTIFQK